MTQATSATSNAAKSLNHAVRECDPARGGYDILKREGVAQNSPLRRRFFAKVIAPSWTSCWAWDGKKTKGYGSFGIGGSRWLSHRVSFFLFRNWVPAGDLDHLCRNRGCVNPFHLEPCTNLENRKRGKLSRMVEITHCDNGHELTSDNLVQWLARRGMRSCLACKREEDRIRAAKWRAENPDRYGSRNKAWWAVRGKALRQARLAEIKAMKPVPSVVPAQPAAWVDQARTLYRSMNTYDIAQVLHVPEAQVYRAVFGTRAALLQRNAGAIGFPQAKQERNTP